jgi:hypothetical protein
VLPLLLSGAVCQPPVHEVALGGFVLRYEQQSSRRLTRNEFEYVFRGTLESPEGPASARAALVTSTSLATQVVDGRLEFPAVEVAAVPAASLDTFRVRHDRRTPFDPAQLRFELDPPNRGLVSSDPASGAVDVPVTAWLRLELGSPVDDVLLASLLLRCDGETLPFSAGAVTPDVLAVNPDGDLPAEVALHSSSTRPRSMHSSRASSTTARISASPHPSRTTSGPRPTRRRRPDCTSPSPSSRASPTSSTSSRRCARRRRPSTASARSAASRCCSTAPPTPPASRRTPPPRSIRWLRSASSI